MVSISETFQSDNIIVLDGFEDFELVFNNVVRKASVVGFLFVDNFNCNFFSRGFFFG
jgi:hypothetical protein